MVANLDGNKMFTDALEIAMKLTIAGESFNIPAGNIKNFTLNLRPYGFFSELSFWVSLVTKEDKIFDHFTTDALIEVLLKIEPHFKPDNESSQSEIEPIELQGLVMDKVILNEVTIENVHLQGDLVLYRHYQIQFADPAFVLWRQHFPCDILVDKSVKELIESNRTNNVLIQYDWPEIEEEFAINTLPLGAENNNVSFYDFIVWYVASQNAVFTYNLKSNEYLLAKNKDQNSDAVAISKLEISSHQIKFPASTRYNDRLMNIFSENPGKKQTDRQQAITGIRRDILVRQPIAAEFDKAFDLESEKQKSRSHEIEFNHCRFPLLTYRPGIIVKLEGGLWSDKIFLLGQEYRVRDVFIQARAVNEEADSEHNMPFCRYHIDMQSQLELKDETALNLPEYEYPQFPLYVEGKIISEQGADEDETYQFYQHPQTSLEQYRIKLPLFDNQQLVAPFEPIFSPGHFYFPAYKDARVLLAVDFHCARIVRFLDWRPDCRLPMESQGNHLLLGINDSSKTSINHIYVDNKPRMNMQRTSGADTQKIQFHEGRIVLETKQEE